MGPVAFSVVLVVMALTATGVLLLVAILTPDAPPSVSGSGAGVAGRGAAGKAVGVGATGSAAGGNPSAAERMRLWSRVLFARRSFDAITIDCTLVRAEGAVPPQFDPPVGLPFTLRLRVPDTNWLASRVEDLFAEWADDCRELVVELHEDKGKIRTTIASGESSVHLELAGSSLVL